MTTIIPVLRKILGGTLLGLSVVFAVLLVPPFALTVMIGFTLTTMFRFSFDLLWPGRAWFDIEWPDVEDQDPRFEHTYPLGSEQATLERQAACKTKLSLYCEPLETLHGPVPFFPPTTPPHGA